MLLVVSGSGKFQKSSIDDIYLNEWFSQYIGKSNSCLVFLIHVG
jgi:hypothetical protein